MDSWKDAVTTLTRRSLVFTVTNTLIGAAITVVAGRLIAPVLAAPVEEYAIVNGWVLTRADLQEAGDKF